MKKDINDSRNAVGNGDFFYSVAFMEDRIGPTSAAAAIAEDLRITAAGRISETNDPVATNVFTPSPITTNADTNAATQAAIAAAKELEARIAAGIASANAAAEAAIAAAKELEARAAAGIATSNATIQDLLNRLIAIEAANAIHVPDHVPDPLTNGSTMPVALETPALGAPDLMTTSDPLIGGGGGGGSLMGGDFSSGETIVTAAGTVQLPSGIEFTGYIYPYMFLLLTIAGGGIGFFVAHKYKQPTLAKLALIAAGLMAGSAIGMKVKPPVKKIT